MTDHRTDSAISPPSGEQGAEKDVEEFPAALFFFVMILLFAIFG